MSAWWKDSVRKLLCEHNIYWGLWFMCKCSRFCLGLWWRLAFQRFSPGLGITLISLYHLGSFPKACLSCQATHYGDIITQNKASRFRAHCIMIGRKQDYYQLMHFFFFWTRCIFFFSYGLKSPFLICSKRQFLSWFIFK